MAWKKFTKKKKFHGYESQPIWKRRGFRTRKEYIKAVKSGRAKDWEYSY
jgi:hypothetical protein